MKNSKILLTKELIEKISREVIKEVYNNFIIYKKDKEKLKIENEKLIDMMRKVRKNNSNLDSKNKY